MNEKITYGIKNVYAAKLIRAESGKVSFEVPKLLSGTSEMSLSAVGEPVKVYADNIVYVKMGVNQGYAGNLSIYHIPDWFYKEHLGYTIDANGVLIEDAAGVMNEFALLFEFNTETKLTKRSVLYNCTAARSELGSKTKQETIEANLFSVPIVASPATDTGYVKASITGDESDATWGSWFDSVYIPNIAPQYSVDIIVTGTSYALVVFDEKMGYTDEDGHVRFMAPAGTYQIYVYSPGSTPKIDSVTVSTEAVKKTIEL